MVHKPPAAAAAPGSLLEIQNYGSRSRPTKSESAMEQDPQISYMLAKIWETLL